MWVAYYWQIIHCNQGMINCKFVAKLTTLKKKKKKDRLQATVKEEKLMLKMMRDFLQWINANQYACWLQSRKMTSLNSRSTHYCRHWN